jgi:hypothetical protein
MSRVLTIHQPNFFPWIGFFLKIAKADIFYVFDHIPVTTGKGWHSRTKIILNCEQYWLTVPIKKKNLSGQLYSEIEINTQSNFVKKHLGTLRQSYAKSYFFDEVMEFLKEVYSYKTVKLCEFNINIIKGLCQRINLKVDFIKTSSFLEKYPELQTLSGNDLVLRLAEISRCDTYFSGSGCLDFIKPESFTKKNINFLFQEFDNINYNKNLQSNNQQFGISIINDLMHTGFVGVQRLIEDINGK